MCVDVLILYGLVRASTWLSSAVDIMKMVENYEKKTKPKVCLIQVGSFYVLIELMK